MAEPTVIDGVYRLKSKLGEGGMATVFLAEADLDAFDYTTLYAYTQVQGATHLERRRNAEEFARRLGEEQLDRNTILAILRAADIPVPGHTVAVKALNKGSTDVARFEAEWKNLMCLSHDNVVKVYGGGTHMKRPYYAMELLDNIVPPDTIREQFTIAQKIEIIMQGARGLAYLHENGLIHRDVKPSNLVTCEAGQGRYVTKVADLGIAKNVGEDLGLTMTKTIMGTPYYMSPEQVDSSKNVDARADVYSLGASLYEFVTGHKPFHNKTTVYQIIYAISSGEVPVAPKEHMPDLPNVICSIIECAMAREADQRYRSMTDMTADLGTYLAEENTDIMASVTYAGAKTLQSIAAAGGGKYVFESILQKTGETAAADTLVVAAEETATAPTATGAQVAQPPEGAATMTAIQKPSAIKSLCQWLGAGCLVLIIVAVLMVGSCVVLLSQCEGQQQGAPRTIEDVRKERDVTDTMWTEVAETFGPASALSEEQKAEEWPKYEGKAVEWSGTMVELDRGELALRVRMAPDAEEPELTVVLKKTERSEALALTEGGPVTFIATLKDRAFILDEGVIVED